ncbi:serine hydrolase domain-containing protein [Acidobacteriota bacterium]
MKTHKIFLFFLFTLSFIFVSGLPFPSSGCLGAQSDDPFADVRTKILEIISTESIPSITIAVAQDGKIIWEEGFGWANREKKIKATPDTMYSLASISKPITATGFMILVERELVDMDVQVNHYLGEAKLKAFRGKASDATIQRLLHHTAGLPTHWNFFYDDKPQLRPSMDTAIDRYGIIVAPPGTSFNYSNFGYGILDYIIERVSKKSYPDFMKSEVFDPLDMKHTAVFTSRPPDELVAERYWPQEGGPIPFYDFDHRGASGVYSSAHDLVRFGMFHLKNHLKEQKPILKDETIGLMKEAVDPRLPKHGYRLGWSVGETFGQKIAAHGGGMPGVRTTLRLLPEKNIAVVVLCNGQIKDINIINHLIFSSLLPEYATKWEEMQKKQKDKEQGQRPKFTPPSELVGRWTGEIITYEGKMQLEMLIEEKGKVWFKVQGEKYGHEKGRSSFELPRYVKNIFQASFNIKIPTEDAARAPHQLWLSMNYEQGALTGMAAARSMKLDFCLPSFIQLTKEAKEK